jgi:ABC-2 type transport system permease protein/oleandomycin transport system permease protein
MSSVTTTASTTGSAPPSNVAQRVRYAFRDGIIVARRNLINIIRVPTVLVFELVQPIMFVLLFRFIYANQFNEANLNGVDYVLFLMPGIFVQNALFGSTSTAIGVADDLKKGLIDRFRSLPMARSAVLSGRTTADLGKNLILVLLVIGVGYLVGFRFENGFLGALGVIALVLAVSFTFSWVSATVGLALKEVEAVQAAIFTVIFPIVFVSSAFVPVQGMISWLQPVAEHNPVTYWCNLARYLSIGEAGIPLDPSTGLPIDTVEGLVVKSALWIAGLLVVFVPLSIRLYRKLT